VTKKASITTLLDPGFMARLDRLDVLSRKILRGKLKGERRSKRRGQSVEFADHRQYVPGDDIRFLDWNIYGRLDQLFLKLFLEEQDLSVRILFDSSASMGTGDPPKISTAKRLAAALAYVGLVNNNRVTVTAFSNGVRGEIAGMRGRRYLANLAEFLAATEAEGATDFERTCRRVTAERFGSGVTIVISDFFFKGGYATGLKRLVTPRYDLCVIQLLSPQEKAPELTGDLRLVDIEDGDTAEITVSRALLAYYRRNLAAFCNELKSFCRRRGALYVLTDSAASVENVVLEGLRRGGLLG